MIITLEVFRQAQKLRIQFPSEQMTSSVEYCLLFLVEPTDGWVDLGVYRAEQDTVQ